MYQQLVTPTPDIPCTPGWCLMYVRQAFGAPIVEPTATAGWANAQYRHEGEAFPGGFWAPLWFNIPGIPEGHVVLGAPDGSIYSTSSPADRPVHHPSLEHLIWYYGARVQPEYQLELQYLGWSEDISKVRVVAPADTATEEIDMATAAEVIQGLLNFEIDQVGVDGKITLGSFLAEARDNNNHIVENTAKWIMPEVIMLRELVKQLSVKQGVTIDYDAIAKAVNDDAAQRMAK